MVKNENVVVAPTLSVTKSSVRRSARLGCKEKQKVFKSPGVSTTSSVLKNALDYTLDIRSIVEADERARSLEYAGHALKLYQKCHKVADDFEIIQVLYEKNMRLFHTKLKCFQHWYHICFTAKPKNNCESDASPTYFFAELKSERPKYCYTFEPRDHKPGYNHGCIICKTDSKIHPDRGEYEVGAPPYITRLECCLRNVR